MESIFLNNEIINKKILIYDSDYFLYKYDNDTLFKYFRKNGQKENDWDNLLTSKGQKINLLSNVDMPENYFKAFVFANGKLIGYTMDNVYQKGFIPINKLNYKSKEQKLKLLDNLKKRLLNFNQNGLIYGDLNDQNVLYNPAQKRLLLLNIDNAKYKDQDFNTKEMYMSYYLKHNSNHLELLDHYMLNIYTMVYLQNLFYPAVFQYLNECKFCYELDTMPNYKIAKEMIDLNENYSGKLLIDNQKPTIRRKIR